MSSAGIVLAFRFATCDGKKPRNAAALALFESGAKSGPKPLFLFVTGTKRKLLHELPLQLRMSLNSRKDQPLVVLENWLVRICPAPSALSPKLLIETTGATAPWPLK